MVNNHRQHLAHGTIWEIARVLQPLQRGAADAPSRTITEEKLEALHGTNCDSAAKVSGVVKGASSSSKPKTVSQAQEPAAQVSAPCFVRIPVSLSGLRRAYGKLWTGRRMLPKSSALESRMEQSSSTAARYTSGFVSMNTQTSGTTPNGTATSSSQRRRARRIEPAVCMARGLSYKQSCRQSS
jgi:hypothetical protein